MAFPTDLTNAVDNETDVLAAHINNVEATIGITGSAVEASHDYRIAQLEAGGNIPTEATGGEIDTGTENGKYVSPEALADSTLILDGNQNEVIIKGSVASAVNEVTITNAAANGTPSIAATGSDTDIDLNLVSKGAGYVQANGVNVSTKLSVAKTWTVATSGGDFTTLAAAVSYLSDKWLGALQTIQLDNGLWTISSTVSIEHAQGLGGIKIEGKNFYTKTISSIASTSGETGNWTYVLNVDSVTDVEQNDYCIIYGATGGTRPEYINGCFKITAVGASTITVHCAHVSASAPSGNVTGTMNVMKTFLYSDTAGASVDVKTGCDFDKIIFVGTGEAGTSGLSYTGGSNVLFSTNHYTVGAHHCATGFNARLASKVYLTFNAVGECANGFIIQQQSFADLGLVQVNGCSSNGIMTQLGGLSSCYGDAMITGCTIGQFGQIGGYALVPAAARFKDNTAAISPTVNTNSSDNTFIKQ